MTTELEKCEHIKQIVERLSGVQNIGTTSQKRKVSDLRKCYCALAKEFTTASLTVIGEVLRYNFDHSTVHNNIKKFKILQSNNQIEGIEFYNEARSFLNSEIGEFKDPQEEIK